MTTADPGAPARGRVAGPSAPPIDVWLDVDPAAGLPEQEVDDALAMIQAFHSPELRVRGVSVVYGNAPLAEALPIARDVAARFGPPGLRVHAGAAAREALGASNAAVEALAGALRERPLTIVALGPLTTIATVVMRHPALHHRVERIVVVAGRRRGQEFRASAVQPEPFPDFNFENDAEAAAAILAAAIPVVLAPWEVASHLWITSADLDALATTGGSGAWLATACRSWLEVWRRRFHVDGFNPFDTLAVSWVTHPQLIEHREAAVAIEPAPARATRAATAAPGAPTSAATAPKLQSHLQLIADPDRAGGRRAVYCCKPKPELKEILLDRLARGR